VANPSPCRRADGARHVAGTSSSGNVPIAVHKEEALLRGFEAGKHNKVAPKVISLLRTHGAFSSFKGDDGLVYTPNRAMTSRMQSILDELKSSQDPIWLAAASL